MRLIDSRVSGPFLDLLIDFGDGDIVAARTAIEEIRWEVEFYERKLSGDIRLKLFALANVPDEWRDQVKRAGLPAPRKGLPKP